VRCVLPRLGAAYQVAEDPRRSGDGQLVECFLEFAAHWTPPMGKPPHWARCARTASKSPSRAAPATARWLLRTPPPSIAAISGRSGIASRTCAAAAIIEASPRSLAFTQALTHAQCA